MNDDFEEDYDAQDDGREDLKRAQNKGTEAYKKYKQQKNPPPSSAQASGGATGTTGSTAGTTAASTGAVTAGAEAAPAVLDGAADLVDGAMNNNPSAEANSFNKQLQQKDMTRAANPTNAGAPASGAAAPGTTAAGTTATGTTAAGTTAAGTTAAGTTAAGTTAAGATAAGTTAAGTTAAGATAAGATAAGTTAAAAGGTAAAAGGAVAAQAAIPVAGWIALAVEAAIALAIGLKKARDKRDRKNAEGGVDTKSMRRLFKAMPLLMPILVFFLIILILVVLMQSETLEKVDLMQRALVCFETFGDAEGCQDFMNTGVHFGKYNVAWNPISLVSKEIHVYNDKLNPYSKPITDKDATEIPLIKRTDWHIARFVGDYILIENKLFKNSGSGFSIKETLEGLADTESLIDGKEQGLFNDIWNFFKKLLEDSFIGDINEAWYLFKWMKMEKKIFNNIVWEQGTINRTGIGPLQDLWNKGTMFFQKATGKSPYQILSEANIKRDKMSWLELGPGDFDIGTGYLKLPNGARNLSAITVDEAIGLTREYIPSFIEVYATYAASGEYRVADAVYKYYVENMKKGKSLELKLTTYEMYTLDTIEHFMDEDRSDHEKKAYFYAEPNEDVEQISKENYDNIKEEIRNSRGWFKNLLSDIKNAFLSFFDKVATFFEDCWQDIKEMMGWNITISSRYVTVVEKGAAFEYKMKAIYDFDIEQYDVEAIADRTSERKSEELKEELKTKVEICSLSCDENGESCTETCRTENGNNGKVTIYVKSVISYKERHEICEHTLRLKTSESGMTKYDEQNRYNYVVTQIEKEEKAKNKDRYVSATDAALAIDLITAYYSEEIGLLGGASASDFAMAGSLNESIVKYAEQFDGKRLAYMRMVDDKNIFFDNHWCAMFVSFCMKKAGVGVPTFYGCSTFWSKYKSKPGFYDVIGGNDGGFITKDGAHKSSLNNVQPGDILLFRWNDNNGGYARDHTGICKSVKKDSSGNIIELVAIEGNTGGTGYYNSKVSIRTYTGAGLKYISSFVSIATVEANGGW